MYLRSLICRSRFRGFGVLILSSTLTLPLSVAAQNQPGSPSGFGDPAQDRGRLQAPGEVLRVPPMPERPLNAEEGPRIVVREFDLQLDPVLSSSISAELVEAMHAELRDSVAAQGADGSSIGDLEAVANKLTTTLRSSGFTLASAYVPAQDVQEGRVVIGTLPGALGAVVVEGNELYSTQLLEQAFSNQKDKPVRTDDLESTLLLIRDFPGLKPLALLGPGPDVGTTALTLRVDETPYEGGLVGDNYGSKFNGEYRVRAWGAMNNPFGLADRLYADVLQSFDPQENTYGSVAYTAHLSDPRITGGFVAGVSSFDVDENILELFDGEKVNGESTIVSLPFRFQAIRSRNFSLGAGLAYSYKLASFDNSFAEKVEDEENVATFSVDMQVVDRLVGDWVGVNSILLAQDFGNVSGGELKTDDIDDISCKASRQEEYGDCIDGAFAKTSIEVSRYQQLFKANALLFRGYYQYTNDVLVPLEQLALGGVSTVRAYPQSQQLVDRGGYARLEWQVGVHDLLETRPANWDLTVFLAGDYGGGENISSIQEQDIEDMSGYGGGMFFEYRFGPRWVLEGRLEAMTGTDQYDENLLPPFDDADTRYWGSIGISYR